MPQLPSVEVACPYCGEAITLFVDDSVGGQVYVEDCQVCCRPIEIGVSLDEDGVPAVRVWRQDDA